MKISILFIFLSTTLAVGQGNAGAERQREEIDQNSILAQQREAILEEAAKAKQLALEQHAQAIKNTLSIYPWRAIDGVTQHVAVTWCLFSGTILQVHPEGIRVDGEFHSMYPEYATSFTGEFFVKHYPFKQADGDVVPDFLAGFPTDVYTYNTASGSMHTIHALDFGIPCDAPPPDPAIVSQMAEEKVKEDAAKKTALERALQANEQAAEAGDVYGLLRMGERYRDGEGVETNLDKARDFFRRAADKGDLIAGKELAALPPK